MAWFTQLFGFKETVGGAAAWESTRNKFLYNAKSGVLSAVGDGATYQAGTFYTPSLAQLRAEAAAVLSSRPPGPTTLTWGITSGVLGEHALHPGATFLAASGLNSLEFTSARQTPQDGISVYEHDKTQGPNCALACAAGTVVRNYFAANTPHEQINLLLEFTAAAGELATGAFCVRSGYVTAVEGAAGLQRLAPLLEEGSASRERLRGTVAVGVQRGTQVTFVRNEGKGGVNAFVPPPPGAPPTLVSQVYAAALSLGGYGDPSIPSSAWAPLATLVLEGAYEATLLNAVITAPPGTRPICLLTGLGMGVFGNSPEWVGSALGRAVRVLRGLGGVDAIKTIFFAGAFGAG